MHFTCNECNVCTEIKHLFLQFTSEKSQSQKHKQNIDKSSSIYEHIDVIHKLATTSPGGVID